MNVLRRSIGFLAVSLLVISSAFAQDQDTAGASDDNPANSTVFGDIPAFSLERFGISDPAARQVLTDVYGTLLGRPDCVKKSVCIVGMFLQNTPGANLAFVLLSRFVPTEWTILYDILQTSVLYGQSCDAYLCDPNSQPR